MSRALFPACSLVLSSKLFQLPSLIVLLTAGLMLCLTGSLCLCRCQFVEVATLPRTTLTSYYASISCIRWLDIDISHQCSSHWPLVVVSMYGGRWIICFIYGWTALLPFGIALVYFHYLSSILKVPGKDLCFNKIFPSSPEIPQLTFTFSLSSLNNILLQLHEFHTRRELNHFPRPPSSHWTGIWLAGCWKASHL